MRILILFSAMALMASSCEDPNQSQSGQSNTQSNSEATNSDEANANMPNDEQIKRVAEAMKKPEAEIRAAFEKCVAEGGKGIIGGFGQPACEKPTPDSGQSCTQNSDCESFCLADTKTCAPRSPMFGCFDVLPEPGMLAKICVD